MELCLSELFTVEKLAEGFNLMEDKFKIFKHQQNCNILYFEANLSLLLLALSANKMVYSENHKMWLSLISKLEQGE